MIGLGNYTAANQLLQLIDGEEVVHPSWLLTGQSLWLQTDSGASVIRCKGSDLGKVYQSLPTVNMGCGHA